MSGCTGDSEHDTRGSSRDSVCSESYYKSCYKISERKCYEGFEGFEALRVLGAFNCRRSSNWLRGGRESIEEACC